MLTTPDKKAWNDEALPIIPLAISDGRAAIAHVRKNADKYDLDSDRIGIMGFSAGGLVAAATAFGYSKNDKPSFVVPVYADILESRQDEVNSDAPPLYLACTSDDEFGFQHLAIKMYKKWVAASRPAELHLFSNGGHGFGIGSPGNSTGNWLEHLCRWLIAQQLMPSSALDNLRQ